MDMLLYVAVGLYNAVNDAAEQATCAVQGYVAGEPFYRGLPACYWSRQVQRGGITLQYQTYFHPPFYCAVPATWSDGLLAAAKVGEPRMAYAPRPLRARAPTPYVETDPSGDPAAVQVLAWLLVRDSRSMVRMYAAETLGAIGWDARMALPELIRATGDGEFGAFAIPVSERAYQAILSIALDGIRQVVRPAKRPDSNLARSVETKRAEVELTRHWTEQ
jgi:hypothetical protein